MLARTGDFRYEGMPNVLVRNRRLELPSLASRCKVIDVCIVHKILLKGYKSIRYSMKQLFRVTSSRTRGCAPKIPLTRPITHLVTKPHLFLLISITMRIPFTRTVANRSRSLLFYWFSTVLRSRGELSTRRPMQAWESSTPRLIDLRRARSAQYNQFIRIPRAALSSCCFGGS